MILKVVQKAFYLHRAASAMYVSKLSGGHSETVLKKTQQPAGFFLAGRKLPNALRAFTRYSLWVVRVNKAKKYDALRASLVSCYIAGLTH